MKSKGREREEKKIERNVSPGAMLPRNFSVSVMRFLNWGPFLVVYKCETEDAVPYVWLVVFVKELVWVTRFAE